MAKILVIDDDFDMVEACKIALEKAGHKVSSASNTEEGYEAIKSFNPDLIILDVMMDLPDDGIVMSQILRSEGMSKPILMLTSVSSVTGMKYGGVNEMAPVDAFEEKPIEPQKLIKVVNDLLAKEK